MPPKKDKPTLTELETILSALPLKERVGLFNLLKESILREKEVLEEGLGLINQSVK